MLTRLKNLDSVFAQAYEEALSNGSGFYRVGIIGGLLQAKHVRHSDVFRFHFIRGKSHSHSRKIWRERSRRSFSIGSMRVTHELTPLTDSEQKICQRMASIFKARYDSELAALVAKAQGSGNDNA